MRIKVCLGDEWPGEEIPTVTTQLENCLGENQNGILIGQEFQLKDIRYKITQDTRFPATKGESSRVIVAHKVS